MAQLVDAEPSLGLQSSDHRDLLNIIDDLRAEGISHYVDLPQIIVCGDQSSGKSSVLEAVSGFPFPRKDNLCTRFATEVILRRHATKHAKVANIPGPDRTDEEKAKLASFVKSEVDLAELEHLISEAKPMMGVGTDMRSFSSDILHIEVAGPSQPHLTLVDLPGLFRAANRQQTDDDAKAVTSLVLSYMKRSRSIILAVVSAKNDFANQIVTNFARQFDPQGGRTLGIITKPDTLPQGSESEKLFVDLAENKDVAFRLGWDVVRNRDFDTQSSSAEERDEVERQFFQRGVWAHLPRKIVGLSALKDPLSDVLQNQILRELPKLLEDVERGLSDCTKTLEQVGTPRNTVAEQRLYLHGVSEKFSFLAKAAVEGNYTDHFFDSPRTALGIAKRFRAVTQNLLISFAKTMRTEGNRKSIFDSSSFKQQEDDSRQIAREAFVDEVLLLLKHTRGRELPGTYSPHLIADLFFEQAQPWKDLTQSFMSRLWDQAVSVTSLILNHAADSKTAEELLRKVVQPTLEVIKSELDDTVARILAPHQAGHPITYNHYFTENLHKLRQQRQRELLSKRLDQSFGTDAEKGFTYLRDHSFDVQSLLDSLTESSIPDMDRFACSEAIDGMMAYYKASALLPGRVAMKTVVDDIAVLAVEKCLPAKIPELLSSRIVISLTDQEISSVAAENDTARAERCRSEREHKALTKACAMLRQLDQSHPSEVFGSRIVQDPSDFHTLSDSNLDFNTKPTFTKRSDDFEADRAPDPLKDVHNDPRGLTANSRMDPGPEQATPNSAVVNGPADSPQEHLVDFSWGEFTTTSKRNKEGKRSTLS